MNITNFSTDSPTLHATNYGLLDEPIKYLVSYIEYVQKCIADNDKAITYEDFKGICS